MLQGWDVGQYSARDCYDIDEPAWGWLVYEMFQCLKAQVLLPLYICLLALNIVIMPICWGLQATGISMMPICWALQAATLVSL